MRTPSPAGKAAALRPFITQSRSRIVAILLVFAAFSVVSVGLSIRSTTGSRHQAAVVEVAARQRTLAERYLSDIMLVRAGRQADPAYTAGILKESARILLTGGTAPAVTGDDDEITIPRAQGQPLRAQLAQVERLVNDLVANGSAVLATGSVASVRLTAHERIATTNPIERLRILVALTSNLALNTARTLAGTHDRRIDNLITLQVTLGIAGLLTSLLLGWALMTATRRQSAHFRSLVTSSTDLVAVFGASGCRYVSESVTRMLGRSESNILGAELHRFVHPADRVLVEGALATGQPHEIVFRLQNGFGEWRQLETHVTDLRSDRHVRGVVLNGRDVTERVQLEEELTRQAFHDSLTGIANRALFRDRLDQSLARSARTGDHLAVLFVDLDQFKQVNDTFGHDAGDQLLVEVAKRFTTVVRPSDTLARLGGDEFALLLDGADEGLAVSVAERLLRLLSTPFTIVGRELSIGMSIGVVSHAGGLGTSEELMRHADVAMYEAKAAGGTRHALFHKNMGRSLGELIGLESEIRIGIERAEFSVHYQPQVSLSSREIVAVEALLRWESPTRGHVPPARFVPVAESSGLIDPLGEFVLREGCRQAARWSQKSLLPSGFVLWVNVSARQLATGGFDRLVGNALAAAEIPASRLGLEITETAIVADGDVGERAMAELRELHNKGVRLAIDDFGTGFSSLVQLRRFPVDLIKIDRSFVQGIEQDTRNEAITAHTVNLAHAIGALALAEGVESDGQLAAVSALGCDFGQGYLFAHPAPADEVSRQLADQRRTSSTPAAA